jgi:hypothetical protein
LNVRTFAVIAHKVVVDGETVPVIDAVPLTVFIAMRPVLPPPPPAV